MRYLPMPITYDTVSDVVGSAIERIFLQKIRIFSNSTQMFIIKVFVVDLTHVLNQMLFMDDRKNFQL